MPTMRFERIALALLVIRLIKHAEAQPGYVPPPTPLPPPVLNPSSPYTVPQPSYRPITPTTPSTTPSTRIVPSDEVTSRSVRRGEVTPPANEEIPSRTTRSHHRRLASVSSAYGPIVIGPPPVAYSYVGHGYPCAWQRSWDGYWYRTSPCSW
jgi:hypothetical protein